jgi:hypothetical protein
VALAACPAADLGSMLTPVHAARDRQADCPVVFTSFLLPGGVALQRERVRSGFSRTMNSHTSLPGMAMDMRSTCSLRAQGKPTCAWPVALPDRIAF